MLLNSPNKPTNFHGLLSAFGEALTEAASKQDVQILKNVYDKFSLNTDHDKKSPMDQAFRDMLLYKLRRDIEKIGSLIKLSVEAVRSEIVSVTIPVVLLGDIFETVTLDKCEQIFSFVEDMVLVWKEDVFFTSCKNNILRMCNDLLRRLSRNQNTVFCGRILLFLSKFFPFSERSGLNIVSEFNLENVTEYGVDEKDMDDALEDESTKNMPIKIDYNLYCKFWSLQDFFRNPNQCYSKAQWKMFQAHAKAVLEAFKSFQLEDTSLNMTKDKKSSKSNEVILPESEKMEVDPEIQDATSVKSLNEANNHFFAKFLTNPKLLALQLSDSNFRRAVLTQFLILFQYLQLPVKFKSESNTLSSTQSEFIKETEPQVYTLLEETPPNGKNFAKTVKHMLLREVMWNSWKNEGCKEFKKPVEKKKEPMPQESTEDGPKPSKIPKNNMGAFLRESQQNNRFYLGSEVLNDLWNFSPDNLQACKSEGRNFLPNVETFLENNKEKGDPSYEWRALRLLARQSPHFFTFLNASSYKITDYLDCVRRKIAKEKLESLKIPAGTTSSQSLVETPNYTSENPNIKVEVENIKKDEESEANETNLTEQASQNIENDDEEENDQEKDQENDQESFLPTGEESDMEEGETVDDENINRPKPVTASVDQIEEIAPLIGEDWKKLGKKLGYTPDELLFFETEHGKDSSNGPCKTMLKNWFAEDDDATLDNWAYMLEGLEMNTAANAVKALIDRLSSQDTQQNAEEDLSD